MIRLAIPACIASLTAAPLPAFAYSCALSPARDAVIVKTDNASDREMTCKVECLFTSPEGPVTISCAQRIPANGKGWYVCLRPTGGKAGYKPRFPGRVSRVVKSGTWPAARRDTATEMPLAVISFTNSRREGRIMFITFSVRLARGRQQRRPTGLCVRGEPSRIQLKVSRQE